MSHLLALIVVLILLIRTQEVFGHTQQGTQQGTQQWTFRTGKNNDIAQWKGRTLQQMTQYFGPPNLGKPFGLGSALTYTGMFITDRWGKKHTTVTFIIQNGMVYEVQVGLPQKTAWYWHYRLTNYRNSYYTRRAQEVGVKNGRLWTSTSQRLSQSRVRVLNAFKYRPRVLHLRPQFSRSRGVAVSRSVQRMQVRLPRRVR